MKPNENCKTEITLIVDASMSEPVNADDLRKLTDGINRMVRFLAALPASGTVSVWKTQEEGSLVRGAVPFTDFTPLRDGELSCDARSACFTGWIGGREMDDPGPSFGETYGTAVHKHLYMLFMYEYGAFPVTEEELERVRGHLSSRTLCTRDDEWREDYMVFSLAPLGPSEKAVCHRLFSEEELACVSNFESGFRPVIPFVADYCLQKPVIFGMNYSYRMSYPGGLAPWTGLVTGPHPFLQTFLSEKL